MLAIDLGTGGPKVGLVSLDGEVLARELERTALRTLPGGGAEQSPREWWSGIVAAARRLPLGDLPPGSLAAVAVTGQWAGTVPVDGDGEPLMDALTWLDSRGAAHARRAAGGAPSLSGRDPFGHLLYLKRERPDVYGRAAAFLEPVDYLTLRLTGRAATSAVTATLHWLTDTRDLADVRYDGRLLAAAGIERRKLPELLPTGGVLGPLTPGAATDLGLPLGVPVMSGTPDSMSAAVGAGAVLDYAAHLYLGTSAWLSCHVPFKRTDPLHSVASLPSALPRRYLVSCEQQTAGASLERLRDALVPGSGDAGYGELVRLAAQAPPGSGRVLFTPWLNGERTPVDDHLVRGGLHNLGLDIDRARIARATLEGVALNARWMQRYVERFVRRRLDPLAFVGGGARSELWCQIMADVLGRTVRQARDPADVNLRGAALLAGLALGELRLEELPARVPFAASFEPRPEHAATYDELFVAFRRIYRSSRRIHARLNRPRTAE